MSAIETPPLLNRRVQSGSDVPLGACWNGTGSNFALFSAHASKVELCLFDRRGRREIERIELPELFGRALRRLL